MNSNEIFTPEAIRNLATAFQQSRVLLTAVELEIFTILDKHLMYSEEVAQKIKCDIRATDRLMNALVGLGLLKKIHGKFYNSESSAKYLVKGKPEYMGSLNHTNNMWKNWSSLTEAVRRGKSVVNRTANNDNREDFIAAMHYRAQREAKIISLMLELNNVNKMLDVGGGSGAFTYEFMVVNPNMKGVVFDLPNIIPITIKYSEQYQLKDRVEFIEGDYLTDSFGNGYDLILLSAIVHINSNEQNNKLIKKCSESLNPGGQIIIRDFIMKEDRTEPLNGALFSLNMLVATESGDTYTENEMREWFNNCGIDKVVRKDTSFGSNLLIGIKK